MKFKSNLKNSFNLLLNEKEKSISNNTLAYYKTYLKEFDEFIIKNYKNEITITEPMVNEWLKLRPNESIKTRHNRCCILRQLAKSMLNNNQDAYLIPNRSYMHKDEHIQYIFSDVEIKSIINNINKIHNTNTYPHLKELLKLLFTTLILCGARKMEILTLKVKHIDCENKIIKIESGKEYINRLIPINDELFNLYKNFITKRKLNYEDYIFSNSKKEIICVSYLRIIFLKLLKLSNIEYMGKKRGPRIHDFRFTFVTKRISLFVVNNYDLNVYLPILQRYLGHSKIQDTLYYYRPKKDIFKNIVDIDNDILPTIDRNNIYE